MAETTVRLVGMDWIYEYLPNRFRVSAAYTPVGADGRSLHAYSGRWVLEFQDADGDVAGSRLLRKLDKLLRLMPQHVPTIRLVTPVGEVSVRVTAVGLTVATPNEGVLRVDIKSEHPSGTTSALLSEDVLPTEVRRLHRDICASVEARCWRDLVQKVSQAEIPTPVRVLVSYRATKQLAAEALARRLAQEGLAPWFDKWEIRAGDSVPGKIEEAFVTTEACLILWSADHSEGKWCTDEMETAIHKRVETGYKIIPVKLDQTPLPNLLAKLRYVDLSDWDKFEEGVREIIQSIFGLELNPYTEGQEGEGSPVGAEGLPSRR